MTATLDKRDSALDADVLDDLDADTDDDGGSEPPQPARPIPAALAPWRDPHPWHGWAITGFLAVLAALTRFWGLGYVKGKIFDEVYYATEAKELGRFGYEDNRGYMFIVHPPLGKWLINLGSYFNEAPTHEAALGWRIAPALAGCLGVIMMSRIARRLFRSNLFGGIAGLLLAMDGLSLVLARTAILDIFLETFIFAGFGALVLDRDQMRARLGRLIADGADLSNGSPSLGPRPWRLLAGVLLGLACAVKWTALSFFVGLILMSWIWDRAALKSAGVRRSVRNSLRRSALPGLGSLIAVPIGTYILCYWGWFTGENSWGRHYGEIASPSTHLNLPFGLHPAFNWGWVPAPIRSLGSYTLQAYRFHETLFSPHTYRSNPWSWLVLGRPVDFYYDGNAKGCGSSQCSREILLIGTPLLWWAFVPMLLWLAWHWLTTRDWRAGAIWVAFLAGWAVWFQDLRRTMFLFYMAPLVPFLILGLTLALGVMLGPGYRRTGDYQRDQAAGARRRWGTIGVCVFLSLVVVDFAWMWPIFTGGLESTDAWRAHMWLPSWV